MSLQPVQPGDKLRIQAAAYNAFVEAARAHRERQASAEQTASRATSSLTTALLRNDTGADLDRFGVVAVGAPVIGPGDNLPEFQSRLTFTGDTPAGPSVALAVTLEPIGTGAIGLAAVAGVVPVRLRKTADRTYRWARTDDGDASRLYADDAGEVEVLWHESGAGTRWAVVRLGTARPAESLFAVRVEQTGGSNGTATTVASYTYTVRSLDGTTIGTSIPLARPRAAGRVITQSDGYGLAFYDGTTLKLWDAGEVPDVTTCPS